MARCGCEGSPGCNCVVSGGAGVDVTGSGTVASPYLPALKPGIGGLVPHIKTNQWHRIPHYSNPVNVAATANRAFATPFQPGWRTSGNHTITGVLMDLATAAASGGNFRLGIYAGTIGADPTNAVLLSDEGIQDVGGNATTTGIKRWTVNLAIAPYQLVWIVLVPQVLSACNFRGSGMSGAGVAEATTPTTLNSNPTAYYSDTGFSGALPASFGAVAGTTAGPILSVLVA